MAQAAASETESKAVEREDQLDLQSLTSKVKLNDGTEIPVIGLGTYVSGRSAGDEEDKLLTSAVTHAVANGYVHIDSAQVYDTERLLMDGIKAAGKKRSEIFITSKLASSIHDADAARKAIQKSIDHLGGYIDLFLIHSPETLDGGKDVMECYKVLMEFKEKGLLKSIGVSNFNVQHLECFAKKGLTVPSVNQFELHVFCVEKKIIEYCKKNEIKIEAYSPIAKGGAKLENQTLVDIAKKYNKSAAQVMLRWALQKGFIVLPKSTTPKRIEANANVFDFNLTQNDISELDKLNIAEGKGRVAWNVINEVEWDEKLFE